MSTPIVSIIVPIYGVAKYLPQCLDSLLAQTMTNFRAIFVDDGSIDGCAAICDDYASRDPRFRVIHQKNGGRSAARNAGIDACDTQWIWFVDGDDYLEPDALERLTPYLEKDSDLILLGTDKTNAPLTARELTLEEKRAYFLLTVSDIPQEVPYDARWLLPYMHGTIIFKLFKRDFINRNGLRFRFDLAQGQDLDFLIRAAKRMPDEIALSGHFYNYCKHASAISFRYSEQVLDRTEKLCMAIREAVSDDPEALKRYYCYAVNRLKSCMQLYFLHHENTKPLGERRRVLRAYARRPFIRDAFSKCDWKMAGYKLLLFSILFRTGSLRLIQRIYSGLFTVRIQPD